MCKLLGGGKAMCTGFHVWFNGFLNNQHQNDSNSGIVQIVY